jgi:hypothetical protein
MTKVCFRNGNEENGDWLYHNYIVCWSFSSLSSLTYSEIFLINNCQCQNEVKNHTVPP